MTKLRLLSALLLTALCLSTAACGAGTVVGAGLYAASHTKLARKHPTLMQSAYCAYHVWRFEKDVRTHHMVYATMQGLLSAHHCVKLAKLIKH